ncbi:MAG TPA: methyl-accepting chemotaxis protein [Mycobacteriales bacterium]|nr:methyl-accepting chemotaxis protein [Mycobacteriales bacterium]
MKRRQTEPGDPLSLGLPLPRRGRHDRIAADPRGGESPLGGGLGWYDDPTPTEELDVAAGVSAPPRNRRPTAVTRYALVPGGLTPEAEQQVAALAGVDLPPVREPLVEVEPVPVAMAAGADAAGGAGGDFAGRVLRVAELVTFGAFVLLVLSAVLRARFGGGSHVHEVPFAAWGLAAAIASLTLATLAGQSFSAVIRPVRRRVLGTALTVALLVAVTGVVSNADGVAGPAWVLFLPVVLVAGAVTGPVLGLLVGGGAAAGVYVAAGLSHTLTVAGIGRLVVLLPAFPAVGWSAGALARLSRDAAAEAQWRRQALESDVRALSALLSQVADGDLSVVPAAGKDADPVATTLAVAFADTLLALRRLVRQMGTVADQLTGRAVDLAGAAEQEAGAIGAQVAAVGETTTTIEELAATAASIADTAVRVSQFAGTTRRDVDAGASAVEQANDAMQQIADRVVDLDLRARALHDRIDRIADTTRVIEQLARRTSILAVNASIEAARAGEHGHGFATVADEVGTLAARAREATGRIDAIVGELQREAAATSAASHEGYEAVVAGAELQEAVVASLARISRMVDRTTAASREITSATRQQRVASDAVVAAMVTVTEAGDRYREGGRRHAAAAARLRDLAGDLRTALGRFRLT